MITLKCRSCGSKYVTSNELPIYGCKNRYTDKDISHILEKYISPMAIPFIKENIGEIIKLNKGSQNPFIAYKNIFFSYYLSKYLKVDFNNVIDEINNNLKSINGFGFSETPLLQPYKLQDFCKLVTDDDIDIHIKNETGNVSGSHKSRHLMGNIIYFDVLYRGKIFKDKPKLAIYSCGNAAMAAAIVAKAANYELNTYIPPNVNKNVFDYLNSFDANVITCPRQPNQDGDPCYIKFQEAITNNTAIPFSCSGIDNWSNIEGGQTLCLEYISQLLKRNITLDGIVIQIGGGALASSAIKTLNDLFELKIINKIPKIYAVQTRGGFPLIRAYYLIIKKISNLYNLKCSLTYDKKANYREQNKNILDYMTTYVEEIKNIANFCKEHYNSHVIKNILNEILQDDKVNNYMWSWEDEPKSIAHGILDDITYDWIAIIHGMLKTGGLPIIIDEDDIINTNIKAKKVTNIKVDYTGSSGLSGLIKLYQLGFFTKELKNIATIFTGIER